MERAQEGTDALRVTLLGTGRPKPQPGRTGPAAMVEAAGKYFVFDCGRCTLQRLEEAGVPMGDLRYLFLTHLHSDHIVGIPDFWLTPWIFGRGDRPLHVWGPDGTSRMMSKLAEAFEFDIHLRRDVDERLDPGGVEVIAEDVEQGVVYEEEGLRITVFDVDHAPIKPAFGYRIDYKGRSAVLSGDTRYSENLIEFSRGVDLLVHEVAAAPAAELQRSERLAHVIGHHTSPEEAASVFSQVKPKVARLHPRGLLRHRAQGDRRTNEGGLLGRAGHGRGPDAVRDQRRSDGRPAGVVTAAMSSRSNHEKRFTWKPHSR